MTGALELATRWNLRRTGSGQEWRGACPLCSYRDALSLTQRDGRALAWCASCQNREGLAVLMRGEPAQFAPHTVPTNPDAAAMAKRKQARALALWERAGPVPGTLAAKYLAARGVPALAASKALRFAAMCRHPTSGDWPALVALVRDEAGQPVALHRTYLRHNGAGKAPLEPPRASLGPVWGGAIRLDPFAPELVIGEGLETAAAAGVLLGLPAWAAISAGNLARGLMLPHEVRAVVVAADPDPPGEAAAQTAAQRWQAEGRRVRIARPSGPRDFADLLREKPHV